MSTWNVLGAAAGLGVGGGAILVVTALRARRPTLLQRVEPSLRARSARSTLLRDPVARSWSHGLAGSLTPGSRAERVLARIGSSRADVERRLRRAGLSSSVEAFRARQIVAAAIGLAVGLAAALTLAATRGAAILPLVLLVAIGAVGGVLACDADLTRRARSRESRMLEEFPTLAELLALAVGAGEGPVAAIERVSTSMDGELAREFAVVTGELRAGVRFSLALEHLADRTDLPALTRFAETVAVATDRGTPLAEVLRAQAQDVREARRTALMEAGGRKEVLMLIPVVFLVLPVTVVFAVFPGLTTLRAGL